MEHTDGMIDSPWGLQNSLEANFKLGFEDSFIEAKNSIENSNKMYVPLDDSKEYLAGLERKLLRLQGKTKESQEKERKKLITALIQTREDHTANFINSDETTLETNDTVVDEICSTLSIHHSVDPQGAIGAVIRKVAPDKVALYAEELCELLKSDILAKVNEEIDANGSYKNDLSRCQDA